MKHKVTFVAQHEAESDADFARRVEGICELYTERRSGERQWETVSVCVSVLPTPTMFASLTFKMVADGE